MDINKINLKKKLIRNLFRDVLMDPGVDISVIEKYVDPSYVQKVDGVELDYNSFVDHIGQQKKVMYTLNVEFISLVQEGNIVFSNHIVTAHKKDGFVLKVDVIAQFTVKNNRLIACDELTELIKGNHEDNNIFQTLIPDNLHSKHLGDRVNLSLNEFLAKLLSINFYMYYGRTGENA